MTKYIRSPFFLKLESTYCLAEWANWKRTSSIFRSIFTKIICLAIMACCLCPVWLFLLSLLLTPLAEGPALTDRSTYTALAKPILGTTCHREAPEMVLNPEPIPIPANVTCFNARVAAPASSDFSIWVRKFTVEWQPWMASSSYNSSQQIVVICISSYRSFGAELIVNDF